MSREIAATILQQLGGNRFIAMTGAKKLGFIDKGLTFRIGKNCKGVTNVEITLDDNDLYKMKFLKVRNYKLVTLGGVDWLYFDMLQSVFTENTGMDTFL